MDNIRSYEGPNTLGEIYRLYGIRTRDLIADMAALFGGETIKRRVGDVSFVEIKKDGARLIRES